MGPMSRIMRPIQFLRPNLVRKEAYLNYLAQIDQSRIYTNFGPLNSLFEERLLSELFGSTGSVMTVANATLGLMLAFAHCRRSSGRYAIMPSFTFVATGQAALWCGLTPYFVDVDPDNWCIDTGQLRVAIEKLGSEIALVVPYATFGTAMDLSAYEELCKDGIPVVVDAAASLGTTAGEQHFGHGFPGAIVFSLHATKAFPVGEGGVIYSDSAPLIAKLRQAANFGLSAAGGSTVLGLNAKLSEFHAAVGLATLDEFASKKSARQQIYDWYKELFEAYGLLERGWRFQEVAGSVAYQFVSVLSPPTINNWAVVKILERFDIQARTYFRPACHQHRPFAECPRSLMAVTESVSTRIVNLPLWEDMTRGDVDHITRTLANSTAQL